MTLRIVCVAAAGLIACSYARAAEKTMPINFIGEWCNPTTFEGKTNYMLPSWSEDHKCNEIMSIDQYGFAFNMGGEKETYCEPVNIRTSHDTAPSGTTYMATIAQLLRWFQPKPKDSPDVRVRAVQGQHLHQAEIADACEKREENMKTLLVALFLASVAVVPVAAEERIPTPLIGTWCWDGQNGSSTYDRRPNPCSASSAAASTRVSVRTRLSLALSPVLQRVISIADEVIE